MGYAGASQCVTKEVVIGYKRHLQETYKITSANSMLAALNCFFHFKGWDDCRVGLFKVQRQLMGSEDRKLTKEEYKRLIKAAWSSENKRLAMIMETIGNTGIRVSELLVVNIGEMHAGQRYNIIANHAELFGTTRTYNAEFRMKIEEGLRRIAENTAKAFGASL